MSVVGTVLPTDLDQIGKVIGFIVATVGAMAGLRRSKAARAVGRGFHRAWVAAFGHPVQDWLTRSIQPQLDAQTTRLDGHIAEVQAANDAQHAAVGVQLASLTDQHAAMGVRIGELTAEVSEVKERLTSVETAVTNLATSPPATP